MVCSMKLVVRILPIIALILLVVVFFLPLFWPVSQIYSTPDVYLSDILHMGYPLKFLLSESLKINQIPLWTDLVGTGFPLISQGQIQAFSLINLLLFKFFPLITAYNLTYVVAFTGLTVGMYMVVRELGWSRLTGIFCSILFGFSGVHIVKILHDDCLQALSYVPLMLWIILRMQKNKKSLLWLLFPFLVSQQILQGHYQYVFMTGIFLGLYGYLFWWLPEKQDRIWIIKKACIICLLSLGLAAIQLIPSFEYFVKTGGREDLLQNTIGSMRLKHFLQFFSPYILGDIRQGLYPSAQYGIGFLETFSYIGLVPILLAMCSFFFIRTQSWVRSLWIIIGIFIVIALEKNSPIYFLFSFPPFSWFRVYSRFLAFITFLFVLLSGYCFQKIEKKFGSTHFIVLFLFFVSIIDILSFSFSYHATTPIADIMKKPELYPDSTIQTRIMAYPNTNAPWYTYMSKNGWKNPKDYEYFLNGGQPDYTILHGVPNFSVYAGYLPKKQQSLLSISVGSSEFDSETHIATISALGLHTLQLHNAGILISPYVFTNSETTEVDRTHPTNHAFPILYKYVLSDVKPQYYLTTKYKKVQYIEEFMDEVGNTDALKNYDAFITTTKDIPTHPQEGSIIVEKNVSTQKIFTIDTPVDTVFIASIFYYPGWNAYIDGNKTAIYPANISGMAIFVPKGTHTLTLSFIPYTLYIGSIISGITLVLYGFLVIRSLLRS